MFNDNFFQEHQNALLWIANNRLFSWLLGMNRLPKPIGHHKWSKITPNSLHYLREDGKYQMFSFTRPRFSEALAFNISPFMASQDFKLMTRMFSPVKYASVFTMLYAMSRLPAESMLLMMGTVDTFFTTAGDGRVYRENIDTVWATCRNNTSGTADYTGTTAQLSCAFSSPNYFLARLFFPADTSSLADTAVLSDTTLSVCGNALTSGSAFASICETSQASSTSLLGSDYDNIGSVKLSADTVITGAAGAFIVYTLTDLTKVSKTGVTLLGLRRKKDFEDVAPTGLTAADATVVYRTSEFTGTSSDPFWTITYTIPVGTAKYSMFLDL